MRRQFRQTDLLLRTKVVGQHHEDGMQAIQVEAGRSNDGTTAAIQERRRGLDPRCCSGDGVGGGDASGGRCAYGWDLMRYGE